MDWAILIVVIAFSFVVGWVACTLFDLHVSTARGLHEPDGYCVLENLTWLDREFCLQNEEN